MWLEFLIEVARSVSVRAFLVFSVVGLITAAVLVIMLV
jgi:hypothetical protein